MAQWIARLTRDRWIPVSGPPAVSLSKKLYSHCLVLVGSRNGFERDLHKQIIARFTIELKQISINYPFVHFLRSGNCPNYNVQILTAMHNLLVGECLTGAKSVR